jgi:hypothetical protein
MSYLLDTCVLSELVKKTPSPIVEQWFNRQQSEQLFLSRVSIAEIQKGLHKIRAVQPVRHQRLSLWLSQLEAHFAGRLLPLTDAILDEWARLSAAAELRGRKLAVMDALIAATATHHPGLAVINPYLET